MLSCCIINALLQGTNGLFIYSLAMPGSDLPFVIDPATGIISVGAPLDYETRTSYQFSVTLINVVVDLYYNMCIIIFR